MSSFWLILTYHDGGTLAHYQQSTDTRKPSVQLFTATLHASDRGPFLQTGQVFSPTFQPQRSEQESRPRSHPSLPICATSHHHPLHLGGQHVEVVVTAIDSGDCASHSGRESAVLERNSSTAARRMHHLNRLRVQTRYTMQMNRLIWDTSN